LTGTFLVLFEKVASAARSPWVRGVASTSATRVTVLIVGLGSTVALARGLGPTGRGVYALAMTLATLGVVVLNLGFHTANTYFASREPESLPVLVSNTFVRAAAVGALGLSLVVAVRALGIQPEPLSFGLIVLVVAWVPMGLVFIQLQPLLLVLGRHRQFNVTEGGWQIGAVALVVTLWVTGNLTPTSAFLVTLAALLAGAVAVTLSVVSLRGPLAKPSMTLLRRALPHAVRSYALTVTGILVIRLDIFLVESRLDTRQVGLYVVAVTICEAIQILPATIGALLLPKLAGLTNEVQQWEIARRVTLATGAVMVVLCGVVALVAEPAVRLLYGEDFSASTAPLYWLLPGIALLGINAVLVHYFLAVGVPSSILVAQALAVALNIGFGIILLGPMGLSGAALASTIAYGFMFASTLAYALMCSRRRERAVIAS
jgi:O-antigen/teichoic acid export membrane protein